MIEQTATVISVKRDRVELMPESTSGCGSCKSGVCSPSVFARALGLRPKSFWLDNHVAAKAGDQVVIGLDPSALQFASATLYLTPLVGLIGAASIAGSFFHLTEPWVILSGLSGTLLAFTWQAISVTGRHRKVGGNRESSELFPLHRLKCL